MNSQKRLLLTLKYLWEKTDEEHPATLKEIGEYLQHNGIETTRKTLQADINLLTGFGIDNGKVYVFSPFALIWNDDS